MEDQSRNLIAVAILTAVGYDYSEWWILFSCDVPTSTLLVLTFSSEV